MLTFWLAFWGMCVAEQTQGTITLRPGLNVASTPAVLSSITFSNWWSNITAFVMSWGKWEQLIIDDSNASSVFRPLQWVLLRNNNSEDVTMTYNYNRSQGLDITLSRGLEAWWNFLGITREDNPFNDIAENTATMIIDFTNNTKSNAVVEWVTYETNASRFKLWKAYWVFLTKAGWTYGGINNYADVNNWSRNLTIDYVYSKWWEAATSHTESVEEWNEYSVVSPEIDYYTADKTTVSGTMWMNDETITVTYSPINDTNSNNVADEEETYILSIYYEFSWWAIATWAYSWKILEGDSYSITSPTIEYYTPSVEIVSWTMPWEDKDITVVYNPTNDVNKNGVADETEAILEYVNSSIRNVIAAWVSDLDVLKINVPEGKWIYEIKLQKYWTINASDIYSVWLENQYWEVVASARSLNADWIVNLLLKEEFNDIDKQELTVVVQTSTEITAWWKLWFKVIEFVYNDENFTEYTFDDDYTPYLYDVINYAGYQVRLSPKWDSATYNYVKWTSYEVASFSIQTPSAASIMFKWFTLTNHVEWNKLDLEHIDTVSVTVGGNEVSNIYYKVTLDDELFIAFDDYELPAWTTNEVVVNVIFKETFDDYGTNLKLMVYSASDIRVMERLNEVRNVISFDTADWPTYSIHGWKITLTNTKLWNIDAQQNSKEVLIGEGDITITEPLKLSFSMTGSITWIDAMYLFVDGKKIAEWSKTSVDSYSVFTFNNVELLKSWKIQFKIDISDNVSWQFTFTTFNRYAFAGAKYLNNNNMVIEYDVAWSISLSAVNITTPKASLENVLNKAVEFIQNDTKTRVVFSGTYTAKNMDIYLNEVEFNGGELLSNNYIAFTLYINWTKIACADPGYAETFSNVKVNAGESVNVKVEAEVEAYGSVEYLPQFTMELRGEDINNNIAWIARDNLVDMRIVEAGTVTVSSSAARDTVLLSTKNQSIATFVVKPANYDEVDVKSISFNITWTNVDSFDINDIILKIGSVTYNSWDIINYDNNNFNFEIYEDAHQDWVVVDVILNRYYTWNIELNSLAINWKTFSNTFKKWFVEALAYIGATENHLDYTKFTISIESDVEDEISDFCIYNDTEISETNLLWCFNWLVYDGDQFEVLNKESAQMVNAITYKINWTNIVILKSDFQDFFKIADTYIKVFRVD